MNHPNIVTVYDVGQEHGVSLIVSGLVEGETLAPIERGLAPLRRLIDVATQIADGLAAAHAAGIAHRDLKPGNVMLTPGGRVMMLDFGLARQDRIPEPESTTAGISHSGAILGTPGYMSPEQVRGEPADALGFALASISSSQAAAIAVPRRGAWLRWDCGGAQLGSWGDLASAGRLPHGDGVWRNARTDGRTASWSSIRHCRLSHPAGRVGIV